MDPPLPPLLPDQADQVITSTGRRNYARISQQPRRGAWQWLSLLPEVRAVLFGQLCRAGSELWGMVSGQLAMGPSNVPGGQVLAEHVFSSPSRDLRCGTTGVLSGPLQDGGFQMAANWRLLLLVC